jgi:hypothetical protein
MNNDSERILEQARGGARLDGARASEELEIRCYLLGERMSDEDRDDLEERLSEDASLFEKMRMMEEELIDDYVLGKLTEVERASFEKHFISTFARLDSLKIALAMAAAAEGYADEKVAAPNSHRPSLLGKLRAHLKIPDEFFVLVLAPQIIRGSGGSADSEVPPGLRPLQINLLLESDLYTSYRVQIRAADGREILVEENLPAVETEAGPAIILRLPDGVAGVGDYTVSLSGLPGGGRSYERVSLYSFSTA